MPISDDEMIVSTTEYFTSESALNPKASAAEIAAFVRSAKASGIVTTTVNGGGVQGVVVVERKKLNEEEANDVRRALGMSYEVEGDEDDDEDEDEDAPL